MTSQSSAPSAAELPLAQQLRLLTEGELDLEGRLIDASNTTLRAVIALDGVEARCVYKPIRGERPLWDFPDGTLAGREVAAYEVSAASGWDIVPPTVMRDGPLGEGACQLWIEEPDEFTPLVGFVSATELPPGWLRVASARDDDGSAYFLAHADDPGLARMALFDAVVNNADRKGGHVLHPAGGHLHGVDHGVCFHTDEKLRTVLWGWAGKKVPADALADLRQLREALAGPTGERLCGLISEAEVAATLSRLDRLIARARFPEPSGQRHVMPWPPI